MDENAANQAGSMHWGMWQIGVWATMPKSILALLVLLLSQSGFSVAPNESTPEGAWLDVDAKWIMALLKNLGYTA